VKSVHRGSLSNSRPYNIIVQYKCALENNEYGRRHSLDIGVDLYMCLAFWLLFQPQRRGSTDMRIDLYASIYGTTGSTHSSALI